MKTVLITGASKGIGFEAVRFIAARGDADIVVGGRNPNEVEKAAAGLRNEYGGNIRVLTLDTSSMNSVREGARALKSMVGRGEVDPLSTLMFNAGMQSLSAPEYSVDGYEKTFATNCLGHFLLLNLLLDEVKDGGRIVWTASGTHDPDTTDGKLVGKAAQPDAEALANTGKSGKSLPGGVRYTSSKLCLILYSYELDRRLRKAGRKVESIAYDPGYIPGTGLNRTALAFMQWMSKTTVFKLLFRLFGGTLGDLSFSGAGLGRVAVDAEYSAAGGKFIQSKHHRLREAKSSRASYDTQNAQSLWRGSERLVKLQPEEKPACIQ